ncbi:MAG: Ldh family oxidoreductase [Burkholderiaceae bacterium]
MNTSATVALSLEQIQQLAFDCLHKAGADDANAQAVADTIMKAERDGSNSHGLFRLPGYVAALRSGKVNGQANPAPHAVTPVLFTCNGDNGFAPLAHQRCLAEVAAAARQYGIAILALSRSHHFAALWPETEAYAELGLAAITGVSYMPAVAPAGGATALFGTNPISFAWPREGATPVVFDMATAAMAKGEVQVAARDGHALPAGTGLDENGNPSTDPAAVLKGVLLPFGGHKGSALAMMVELMAGPLVGETVSAETARRDNKDGGPPQGGQFVLVMSPGLIGGAGSGPDSEAFFARMESIPGARLPGQRRHENRLNTGPRQINAELIDKIKTLND